MANYITKEGLEKLKQRLNKLMYEERPVVVKQVQTAREMGDLKENAEYHAAREKQRNIDAELGKIGERLKVLQVIDSSKLPKGAIRFGAWVTLMNLQTNKEENHRIVGPDETDFEDEVYTYTSLTSPLGKAMLGKKEGDEILVKAPIGDKKFKIIKYK